MFQTLTKSFGMMVSAIALTLAFGLVAQPAFAADPDCDPNNLSLSAGAKCAQGTDQQSDLFGPTGIFKKITDVLLFIIGAVSVIMLIIGGIRYTVSGGDQNAVTAAKNTILYAIIGIVVAILAYAAVSFVVGSFAGTTD